MLKYVYFPWITRLIQKQSQWTCLQQKYLLAFFPLLLWDWYERQNMHPVLWPSKQPMQSQVSSRIKSIKMWLYIKRQFPHHYRRKYSKFILNLQLKYLWIIFLNSFKVSFSYLFNLNFIFDPEGKYHRRKK